ncbi:hypothetical protein ACFYYL_43240, partial [Actinomadura geliboluensis]|uniref:hypothetical protein n=1 Tax=Actinomadura geliboluensis TaxID=882440 RepID=UPI003679BD76
MAAGDGDFAAVVQPDAAERLADVLPVQPDYWSRDDAPCRVDGIDDDGLRGYRPGAFTIVFCG